MPDGARDWLSLTKDYSLPAVFGWICFAAAGLACWAWNRSGSGSGMEHEMLHALRST